MTTLPVEELTEEAFARYGDVIELPRRDHDAEGPGWRWWAETVLLPTDGRGYGVGYLDLQPAPLRFDWAERHVRSTEVIVPLSGEILCYVGPQDGVPDSSVERERFRVFRVRPGQGISMLPEVWHGAPLVSAPARAMVLLLEGTPRDDVTIVRFEDDPVEIEA